jgi:type I restriction enzyme S subunit
MKPLGSVATLQRGFDLPVQVRREGPVTIFAANGPVGTHDVHKVKGPGVVTGRSGTLGKVHFVEEDYWPLNTALWVKDFHGNDPAWVCRLLTWMRLEQFTRGAGVPTLNRNLAHVVEVPLPPLAEQKRIAGILDAADALRAKRRESLAQLDTLLQSTFLDMFGDPVTNPMGWRTVPLEDLCEKIVDCPHSTPRYSDNRTEFYCVRSSDIQDGRLDLSRTHHVDSDVYFERISRHEPQAGEVVYTREGGRLGLAGLVPPNKKVCLGQRMMLFRAAPDVALSIFLWSFLNSPAIYRQVLAMSGGGAAPRVNIKQVKGIETICPPLTQQKLFGKIVEAVEGQSAIQRAHLAELDTLFASLQSRAFRGDL